ncbi:unnamed protein product [Alopecurus aequalis]
MTPGMVSGEGEPVPQLQSRNVCVVGAGMAGLAAARELRREGHAVTVLEQCGDVGGQWLYDPSTDGGDLFESAAEPVSVHSSMYDSLRLISGREAMGFSDFQFVPRPGRDARSFSGHREVYCYLRDFSDAFGLSDAIRLNTRVFRVAMAPPPATTRQWEVRSVTGETVTEEVFDAVVVANGHYSQPRLPSIRGMGEWTRRQLHSHSYRVPEPFRGEVVVMVGCGDSGRDIALDLRPVAREVHLSANTPNSDSATTPAMSRMLANHANLYLHPQIERLHADGRVVFVDGSCVVADAIVYCTGYAYSFPFLDTGGAVTVDADDNVKLYEFGGKYCDIEDWKIEIIAFDIARMKEDVEAYRELDRRAISDNVRRGLERWLGGPSASAQAQGDHQTTAVAAVDAQDMPPKLILDVAEVDAQDMTEERHACLAGIPA